MKATKTLKIFTVGLCVSLGGFSIAQDADNDGFPVPFDCDDNDASIHPAAVEIIGDGIDNNCDGIIDTTYNWGGPGGPGGSWVDADGDGFFDFEDCDDTDASINPAAPEIMGDGIDNNCDGLIDSTYSWGGNGPMGVDADGDGFPDFIDCDDNDPAINPAAVEIIGDGIDNNCDGIIDSTYTWGGPGGSWVDADGDGFFDFEDCNDNDASINPAAPEIMGDGIDNNCDGLIDSTYSWGGNGPMGIDADGDGFPDFMDCDDNDPTINPAAPEIMGDGIDNNCDGLIDSTYNWNGNGPTGVDADGDGFPDYIDCDDNDPNVHPAAVEIIGDGIDNNCDGLIDTTFTWGGGPTGVDADGDGYPDFVDCDDNDPNVHPGAVEIPGDGIDNNCNGVIDLFIPAGGTPTDNTSSSSIKWSNELIESIGPNPTSHTINLVLKSETNTVRVLDMTGKVMELPVSQELHNMTLDFTSLPSGVYLLEVSNEQTRVVERIQKK